MLAEVANLCVMAQLALPLLKLHHTRKNFQQRGLPRAIRPYQDRAITTFNLKVQSGVNPRRAVSHVDPPQIDRALPAARGWRNLKSKRLPWGEWLLDCLHSFNLLELAHGLRRLGSHRAKSIRKLLQRCDLLLLIVVGGQ